MTSESVAIVLLGIALLGLVYASWRQQKQIKLLKLMYDLARQHAHVHDLMLGVKASDYLFPPEPKGDNHE
jgi:hypothetical protein